MVSGSPNRGGFDMSRNGWSSGSRSSPICQSHWRGSGMSRLEMTVPKMSENYSFIAPDWDTYSSRAVWSVTPWNISWPTTSWLDDSDRSTSPCMTWPYTIWLTSWLQKALTHCLGPGLLGLATTQLIVETIAPPLPSMLSRWSTVRRESDTATALA